MGAGFKRWAPLLGTALLASVVVLRLFGMNEAATTVESLGGATGLSAQSPVGYGELIAAGAALAGVGLKVRSEWKKARSLKP